MTLLATRGGVPFVLRDAAVAEAGRKYELPFVTNYVIIRVAAGDSLFVYFTEADFTAGVNGLVVPGGAGILGEWRGPLEIDKIWLAGDGDTADVELVAFQRRG
jgi:hypothetical protein